MLPILMHNLELVARAGGGGSSGGGGGSSGGSSGGGGGVGILAIGYLPPYYVTNFSRKKLGLGGAIPIGIIFTLIWAIVMGAIFSNSGLGFFEVIASIAGFFMGLFGVHGAIFKNFKAGKEAVNKAAALDSAWDEATLRQTVSDTFMRFQKDWSTFNYSSMKSYTTAQFYAHNELLLKALQQLKRTNTVEEPQIISIEFSAVDDEADNSADSFTAYISAKATDKLIDSRTDTKIFEDRSSFSEEWTFMRADKGWKLSLITPTTSTPDALSYVIRPFAAASNLYYREDMGWLLIPAEGNIFSKAKFGVSDVNNHCIGYYHDQLIQLYSYVPNPNVSTNGNTNSYVIAQVAVPNKNYGRIVVESKRGKGLVGIFGGGPKGLRKIETESVLLNKNFTIYADSFESVTAFELLDPLYIEQLLTVNFPISIEVYDNTIYLYSGDNKAEYPVMLDMLSKAFAELKL